MWQRFSIQIFWKRHILRQGVSLSKPFLHARAFEQLGRCDFFAFFKCVAEQACKSVPVTEWRQRNNFYSVKLFEKAIFLIPTSPVYSDIKNL